MTYRILTHAGCMDGFCSAFVVKKYWNFIIKDSTISEKDIQEAEILPLYPSDVQSDEFQSTAKDIIVDLSKPKGDVLFWCDHHTTNKPENIARKNYYWQATPSCAGLLLDIAIKNGLKLSEELRQFREAIDKIDGAEYTKQEITDCYYQPKDWNNLSSLQKLHALGAMFNTRDRNLNQEIFKTLLTSSLQETPLSSKALWQLYPQMYFRAQLQSYQEWRDHVDAYVYYDEPSKCAIQDDRKVSFSKGIADRFYLYFKYPQASYTFNIKPLDEETARIGLGSNIFHRERCKVDLGRLCMDVGKKFGQGSGGGHKAVGGATVLLSKADLAREYVLEKLKEGEKK